MEHSYWGYYNPNNSFKGDIMNTKTIVMVCMIADEIYNEELKGMTAEEFFEMYMAKNKENHRRQDAGYTADVSYRDQAVEDVMNSSDFMSGIDPSCTILMDGKKVASTDFIAIIGHGPDSPEMLYHTDALTLGLAVAMCASRYHSALEECSPEEREAVEKTLEELLNKEAVPNG